MMYDLYLGVEDTESDVLKRIESQHKFEKDLKEFLKTNPYTKDKVWAFGSKNDISKYAKDKCKFVLENKLNKE